MEKTCQILGIKLLFQFKSIVISVFFRQKFFVHPNIRGEQSHSPRKFIPDLVMVRALALQNHSKLS